MNRLETPDEVNRESKRDTVAVIQSRKNECNNKRLKHALKLVLGDVRYAADVKQRSTVKRSVGRGSASSGQSQYMRRGHEPPKRAKGGPKSKPLSIIIMKSH